jgi:hypothetical protein
MELTVTDTARRRKALVTEPLKESVHTDPNPLWPWSSPDLHDEILLRRNQILRRTDSGVAQYHYD